METRSNHLLVGGVTLGLVAGLVAFLVWIAGIGTGSTTDYDIFFKQSVDGLSKGSSVTFSGVPVGQVKEIALWKASPEFVRVRVTIKSDTPILQGTNASLQGSFTGPSTVLLDGAIKGAPAIAEIGPAGALVIPAKSSGLGALLSNAPQLLERLSTLTERLTEVLSDKNQARIAGILENSDRLTGSLADAAPELKSTIAEARATLQQANGAIEQFGQFAGTANKVMGEDGKPLVAELRRTLASAQSSMVNLDAAIADARPGIRAFSTQTLPEVAQLVRDLRATSESLGSVAAKIDQQGAGALLGGTKLPDYKPGKGE